MTVGELLIKLGYETDESSKKKAQNEANALKGTLGKILGAVGIAFTVTGIKNFIQETSSAYADFKATATQFKNTFDGIEEQAQASLNKVSEATGISSNRIKATYSSMGSFAKTSGMDAAQANEYVAKAMQEIADNAAYMDVSVEEAADTFQRLLKGNFQVDDKMNFNFTEDQRNALANEMYGANFADLEDVQKFEVVYEKLRRANIDMGAVKVDENGNVTYRQAASEAGEYTNQVGELSDAMAQLKVSVGSIFLEPMLKVMTKVKDVAFDFADALGDVEDEASLAHRAQEKLSRIMDKLINGFDKAYNLAKNVVKAFGGINNILKLLGIIIGVILAYKVVGKILTAKEALAKFAQAMAKVNWHAVATVASIILLALVIEDLIGFVQGKDSLFGRLLDKAGIDPEPIRNAFLKIWEVIKAVGEVIGDVFGAIKDAIAGSGIDIDIQSVVEVVLGLIAAFGAVVGVIKIIMMVVAAVKTATGIFAVLKGAVAVVSAAFAFLTSPIGLVIAAIAAIIAIGVLLYQNWDTVKQKAQELWDKFCEVGQGIAEGMTAGLQAIIDAVGDVTQAFTDLVSNALTWGTDFVKNLLGGIGDFGSKIKEKIGSGIQWLSDNVGHSKPKEGPLKDDDKWMPDMMDNFYNGIQKGKDKIRGAIAGMADILANSKDSLVALGANLNVTGQNAASDSVNRSVVINQYNSFANTFNGDTRSNQVTAAGQMKSNAKDTTSYLANAIAFGR